MEPAELNYECFVEPGHIWHSFEFPYYIKIIATILLPNNNHRKTKKQTKNTKLSGITQ